MSVPNRARFIDGPAAGHEASPPRISIMLRVQIFPGAKAEVLLSDQEPNDMAGVFAYIMSGNASTGFWDGRDEKGRRTGGQFTTARYVLLACQPPREAFASGAWIPWCDRNKTYLMEIHEATKKSGGGA